MKQGSAEKKMKRSFFIETASTKAIQSILEAVLKPMLSEMT